MFWTKTNAKPMLFSQLLWEQQGKTFPFPTSGSCLSGGFIRCLEVSKKCRENCPSCLVCWDSLFPGPLALLCIHLSSQYTAQTPHGCDRRICEKAQAGTWWALEEVYSTSPGHLRALQTEKLPRTSLSPAPSNVTYHHTHSCAVGWQQRVENNPLKLDFLYSQM